MPAGQVRVAARAFVQQRGIFRQHRIRAVAASDPQLVLPLLPPFDRRSAAIHLEPQIVLMAGADLPDVNSAARASLEANEYRGKVLAPHLELFATFISGLPAGALAKVSE